MDLSAQARHRRRPCGSAQGSDNIRFAPVDAFGKFRIRVSQELARTLQALRITAHLGAQIVLGDKPPFDRLGEGVAQHPDWPASIISSDRQF